ncbi:MAG: acetyl-CoA carboxylase biotin carboxyl carrier protein subunit [Aquimarina sp.]|nr:acetyl-CoA carboxylase biotin carboxyl carrier protein subunit [Aquimarina sp.]
MSKTFRARLNNSLEFDISKEEIINLDYIHNGDSELHIIQDHNSIKAQVISSDFLNKKYTVKIDSNLYTVELKDELDLKISEMGFSLSGAKNIDSIMAPMPGLLLDIMVKVSQEVKENDPLLILEAMKMENVIVSPRNGIIKSIAIDKGAAVEKNQLLIEFE